MQIELKPEIESVFQAESSITGLTPAKITERILTEYALGRLQGAPLREDEPISPELLERRRLVVEAWVASMAQPDAPRLNLPEGVSIRQWLHEDRRYKD
jgi:hypothetical protein